MCATCGCNYKNYNHRPGEMKTTMPGSYSQSTKTKDAMPKVPKVPPMPRSAKRGK